MAKPSVNRAALDTALVKFKARVRRKAIAPGLYHVDLAGTVSAFVSETEKHLDGIFVTVEPNGAILLLDEADALFGKRSQIGDAHDRYANAEATYLLSCLITDRWPPRLR